MPMIRSVLASVKKADETFALIDPSDVIAIGVSGGKDSMGLLYALHLYQKFAQKDFRIVPICLDLGFPGFDPAPIAAYCDSLGHPLQVIDSREVYPILLQHTKPGHHVPCSICSRMKKAAINDAAKKLGCNKVAFAHHRDDALETLFMNMIHGGRVATFEPKMTLSRAEITFIRPLIFASEAQLIALAEEENLPVLGKVCPADGYTERQYCKELLQGIYKDRPEAEANFASMLYEYPTFKLYFDCVEYPNPFQKELSLKPLLSAEEALAYQELAKEKGWSPLLPGQEHFLVLSHHEVVGSVSFSFPNAHQMDILGFSSCLDEESQKDVANHVLDFFCRKINPLLFTYVGENENLFLEIGFKKGMPPVSDKLTKRIVR